MLKNTAEGDTAVFFVCHKTTHPPARAALPFRLGDAFCARRVLLLVFVDLDIAGRVFILNKQQGGGQATASVVSNASSTLRTFMV